MTLILTSVCSSISIPSTKKAKNVIKFFMNRWSPLLGAMELILLPLVLLNEFSVLVPLSASLVWKWQRLGQMASWIIVNIKTIDWLNEYTFILTFYKILLHRKSEIAALVCASLLGMPGGCLLFIPFYHPMHDYFKVPSEVTSVSILMAFTAIVWKFDRKSNRYEKPAAMNGVSKLLFVHLMLHYLINLGTAIFFNPEDVVSIGLHQTIGNCNETEPVHTVLKVFQSIQMLNNASLLEDFILISPLCRL